MAEAQEPTTNAITKHLSKCNFRGYEGKVILFPFVHPDTKVQFSPISLKQDLPGEVFTLSYEDCDAGCPIHEEILRDIIRERFIHETDDDSKTFYICFRQFLYRKGYLHGDMTVRDVTDGKVNKSVKLNARHQYMVEDDNKFLEVLKKLGAVQESEEKLADVLKSTFNGDTFKVGLYIDFDTLMICDEISRGSTQSIEKCITFPSASNQEEPTSGGVVLLSKKVSSTSRISKLRKLFSDPDPSVLLQPGLGILSKVEIGGNLFFRCSRPDQISYLIYHYDRVNYNLNLDGVKITVYCKSGVNHEFDFGNNQSFVHQRFDREPRLHLQRSAGQSLEHFISVVARVIVALKNAVQSKELHFKMYDVIQSSKRRFNEAEGQSPQWCKSPHCKPQTQDNTIVEDLKRVRDCEDLPSILGSSPDAHTIALRAKARSLQQKMNEVTQAEMLHHGLDLTALKKKLRDAASSRGLNL